MPHAAFRAVLLDLDGTLVDSAADLAGAVGDMLAERGLAPHSVEDVRAMIGDGAAELVRRSFVARGMPPPDGALDRFREAYGRRCTQLTRPYDGVPELLRDLDAAGRLVAVVTNKPTSFSERILESLGLAPHGKAVVGPERVPAKKPSPEHVRAALQLLDADASDAVMVGDGPTDMASARDAGVATIGVLWGYRPKGELLGAGAQRLAANVPDLRAMLIG